MTRVPLVIQLKGRKVLVAGAGPVGLRRARALSRAGARVTVVAPRMGGRLPKGCRLLRRRFRSSDAAGCLLVVAATSDRIQNDRIAARARASGSLVNLTSASEASEVWFPAVVRRGSLMIAVSTGSSAPAVARRIQKELARAYGPAYGLYLRLLDEARRSVKLRVREAPIRRSVLRRLASPDLFRLCQTRGGRVARREMWRIAGSPSARGQG